MPKVTYIEFNGTPHAVDVPVGNSVMEGAKHNGVPGIDADCGGNCSCGTCHVYIEPEWRERVGPRTEFEELTIQFSSDVDEESSRLGCQIRVTDALDGLVVRMPPTQK